MLSSIPLTKDSLQFEWDLGHLLRRWGGSVIPEDAKEVDGCLMMSDADLRLFILSLRKRGYAGDPFVWQDSFNGFEYICGNEWELLFDNGSNDLKRYDLRRREEYP
jgi:hypothetical protein